MRFFRHADGSKSLIEEEHRVKSVKQILPVTDRRKERLVQFYAVEGGQRTVAVSDIVDY